MDCGSMGDLIYGYLDRELDLSRNLEVEQHLGACAACSRIYRDNLALQQVFVRSSLYYDVPNDVRAHIHSAIRRASKAEPGNRRARWWWAALWAPLGAIAVMFLSVLVFYNLPSNETLITQEALTAHVRSLMPGHLVDVPSSDQHTVKPWFNGRLDYSPPVKDLAAQGFTLLGARLDYVGDRPVAALVYQRRKHLINLFIWPSERPGGTSERSFVRRGYNMILWASSGMNYLAVSDVNEGDLKLFCELVRQ